MTSIVLSKPMFTFTVAEDSKNCLQSKRDYGNNMRAIWFSDTYRNAYYAWQRKKSIISYILDEDHQKSFYKIKTRKHQCNLVFCVTGVKRTILMYNMINMIKCICKVIRCYMVRWWAAHYSWCFTFMHSSSPTTRALHAKRVPTFVAWSFGQRMKNLSNTFTAWRISILRCSETLELFPLSFLKISRIYLFHSTPPDNYASAS